MVLKLIFDSQFVGTIEYTLHNVSEDDLTEEFIRSAFLKHLGIPYNNNCMYEIEEIDDSERAVNNSASVLSGGS